MATRHIRQDWLKFDWLIADYPYFVFVSTNHGPLILVDVSIVVEGERVGEIIITPVLETDLTTFRF